MRALRHVQMLAIAFAVCWPAAAQSESVLDRPVTADQARDELDLAYQALTRTHPGVYRHRRPAELKRIYGAVRDRITDATSIAAHYLNLAELIGAVCDAHTSVRYFATDLMPYDGPSDPVFGEKLITIGGEIYLARQLPGDAVRGRIERIADQNASEIATLLKSHVPVDGCWDNHEVVATSHESSQLITAQVGSMGNYTLRTVEPGTGKRVDEQTPNAFFFEIQSPVLQLADSFDKISGFLEADFKAEATRDGMIWLHHAGRDISYVTIADFAEPRSDAIDTIMRAIIKRNPGRLIVDLQGNPGGSLGTKMRFASYLLPRSHRPADRVHMRSLKVHAPKHFVWREGGEDQFRRDVRTLRQARRRNGLRTLRVANKSFGHPHYRGPVTVLINHETFSAAAGLAYILKQHRDVTLIGVKTGGSPSHYCARALGYYVLPHSKIRLLIPSVCWSREGRLAKRYLYGVTPDIPVAITPDNRFGHTRLVMDAALRHLDPDGTLDNAARR